MTLPACEPIVLLERGLYRMVPNGIHKRHIADDVVLPILHGIYKRHVADGAVLHKHIAYPASKRWYRCWYRFKCWWRLALPILRTKHRRR